MSDKKQTAVELLVEEIYKWENGESIMPATEIVTKAKELEKQRLKEVWNASQENMRRQFSCDTYKPITFEQYYTETYEK